MIGTHSEGDTLLRTMSEGRMDVKKDMRKTENDVTGLGDEGRLQLKGELDIMMNGDIGYTKTENQEEEDS